MVPNVYEVVRFERENDDTATLELEPRDRPIAPPAPGQFNMLWVPAIGEVPISLAGVEGHRLVHTIRSVGAVTSALCELRPGDQLGVRGPFGRGWGLASAVGHDVLIVAGGLGLVPLRPLIRDLVADRDRFGEATLLVGARTPDGLVYPDELERWRGSMNVAVTVDIARSGWVGHVGVVTDLLKLSTTRPGHEIAFVCGPEIMMRVVAAAIVDRGTPAENVEVSLERNMHCGIGHCGRCQLGAAILCQDGPVVAWNSANPVLAIRGR